jgi:hypothetical protein
MKFLKTIMNKFDLVQKVFKKLNIDYPSSKVLQSLKIVNLTPQEFLDDIIESVGGDDESKSFFSYYLKQLEKTTPQGFFIDLSKYYEPGSFVVIKFDKVYISEWAWGKMKVVDVDVYDTDSRIVLPDGTFTLDNIMDLYVDDLGDMGVVDEIRESISGVIESELQRNLGVPFNSEWSK